MQFNKRNANTPYSSGVVSYTNTRLENVNLTAVLPTRTNKASEFQTEHEFKKCCAREKLHCSGMYKEDGHAYET